MVGIPEINIYSNRTAVHTAISRYALQRNGFGVNESELFVYVYNVLFQGLEIVTFLFVSGHGIAKVRE